MDYKYVGKSEYIPGVPARDLTKEEWAAIPDSWRKLAGRLYQVVEVKKKEVKRGDV